MALEEGKASRGLTESLTAAIIRQDESYVDDPCGARQRRDERQRRRDATHREEAEEIAELLEGRAWRGFQEGRTRGGSSWLAVVPLDSLGLDLDRQTFRDAVAPRMGLDFPDRLPEFCPSCGDPFSVDHALKCKKGPWIGRRHREVVRAWMRYLEKGGSASVREEPPLAPLRGGIVARPSTTCETDTSLQGASSVPNTTRILMWRCWTQERSVMGGGPPRRYSRTTKGSSAQNTTIGSHPSARSPH